MLLQSSAKRQNTFVSSSNHPKIEIKNIISLMSPNIFTRTTLASAPLVLTALSIVFSITLLTSCANQHTTESGKIISQEQREQSNQFIQTLVDDYYQYTLAESPNLRLRLGIRQSNDLLPAEWDDISKQASEEHHAKIQEFKQKLNNIDFDALDLTQRTNAEIFALQLNNSLEFYKYRDHDYPLSQMGGMHTYVTQVLINQQSINSIADAHQYIKRVRGVKNLFKELNNNLIASEKAGALPPKFVFKKVIEASENVIHGIPFKQTSKVKESPIWNDFTQKISKLDMYPESRNVLEYKLKRALLRQLLPAYKKVIATLYQHQAKAPKFIAAKDLKDGQKYYQQLLQYHTGTQLTADEIHQIGLNEVARIQTQIRELAPELGYQATDKTEMKELFAWIENNTSKFESESDSLDSNNLDSSNLDGSNQEFIDYQKQQLNIINALLPAYFDELPSAPIVIKPVEEYRQMSSPIAFYQSPSLDGKRPGIYYVNTSRKNDLPKYRLAALTFHEALPGHHLQIATALENKALADFRRLSHHTAYSEGWALYAEKLALEMDAYSTAEDKYGQLILELWRAARLVIDTGLHAKGWSFDQALEYRLANTPFSEQDSQHALQRYLVMPGQATSYKIGQMEFERLRKQMELKHGSQFNLAKFHSFVLQQGSMPLSVLEIVLNQWKPQ